MKILLTIVSLVIGGCSFLCYDNLDYSDFIYEGKKSELYEIDSISSKRINNINKILKSPDFNNYSNYFATYNKDIEIKLGYEDYYRIQKGSYFYIKSFNRRFIVFNKWNLNTEYYLDSVMRKDCDSLDSEIKYVSDNTFILFELDSSLNNVFSLVCKGLLGPMRKYAFPIYSIFFDIDSNLVVIHNYEVAYLENRNTDSLYNNTIMTIVNKNPSVAPVRFLFEGEVVKYVKQQGDSILVLTNNTVSLKDFRYYLFSRTGHSGGNNMYKTYIYNQYVINSEFKIKKTNTINLNIKNTKELIERLYK